MQYSQHTSLVHQHLERKRKYDSVNVSWRQLLSYNVVYPSYAGPTSDLRCSLWLLTVFPLDSDSVTCPVTSNSYGLRPRMCRSLGLGWKGAEASHFTPLNLTEQNRTFRLRMSLLTLLPPLSPTSHLLSSMLRGPDAQDYRHSSTINEVIFSTHNLKQLLACRARSFSLDFV